MHIYPAYRPNNQHIASLVAVTPHSLPSAPPNRYGMASICFNCVCIYICMCVRHVDVSLLTWVVGTKLRSSGGARSTFNYGAISPDPC